MQLRGLSEKHDFSVSARAVIVTEQEMNDE